MSNQNGYAQWMRGYVYAGGQLVAIQDGSVKWVHQEPVTKGQRLTDTSGAVVAGVELDPWGGDTSRSFNQAVQPHKFTSYERDTNGGDEAMFRRYEGRQQRFAQPDPYDGSYDSTDPQSFNRYTYVQNDPVNFVDPTGLWWALVSQVTCSTATEENGQIVEGGQTTCIRTYSWVWVEDVGSRSGGGGYTGGGGGGGIIDIADPPLGTEPKDFPCPPNGEELANHPGFSQLARSANQYAMSGDRGYVEAGGWILMNRQGALRWQIKTREPRDHGIAIYGLDQPQNYRNTMGNGWIVIADFHTHVNELPNANEIDEANRRGVPGIWIYPSGKGEAYGPKSGLFGRALPKGC